MPAITSWAVYLQNANFFLHAEQRIVAAVLEAASLKEGRPVVYCGLGQVVGMRAVRLEEASSAQLAAWLGRHSGGIPEPHDAVLMASQQQPLLRWLRTRF